MSGVGEGTIPGRESSFTCATVIPLWTDQDKLSVAAPGTIDTDGTTTPDASHSAQQGAVPRILLTAVLTGVLVD